MKVENDKKEADARGYMLEKTPRPYKDIDWKTLMAIQPGELDAREHIAFAFRELAEKADKIDHLTITPDLLASLMDKSDKKVSPVKKKD